MQLINTDRATFEQLDPTRRIIDADHAHRFAIVRLEKWGDYGLGWNSELIEPSIATLRNLIWIGVDQDVVVLDSTNGRVRMALPLWTPLFDIAVWNDSAIVISELEILAFNFDASLRFVEGLPDIAANWSFQDDQLSIELLDHATITLDLRTGKELSAMSA
jgi:hypothetical protein